MSEDVNRHLLLAVDGSTYSRRAARYLASLFSGSQTEITIISVAEPVPEYLLHGASSFGQERERYKKLEEIRLQQVAKCEKAIDAVKSIFKEAGFPNELIHSKGVSAGFGPVRDILMEARRGLYDALVMGRRGLGKVSSYFMGSVSYAILQQVSGTPLWLVDRPVDSRKVLVALDSCDPCVRVLDHVGFMLSGMEGLEITVLHVIPRFNPFGGDEEMAGLDELEELAKKYASSKVESMLEQVAGLLEEAGISRESVKVSIKGGVTGAAREILRVYKRGGYGTLVLGRRGVGGWEAMFPGSVSNKVLASVDSGAVWIVT